MLTDLFEVAAGSVTGRDHVHSRKPNQDAYHTVQRPELMAGVVCDGCGDPESPHSGVGAQLGVRWTLGAIAGAGRDGVPGPSESMPVFLETVRAHVLEVLAATAETLAEPSGVSRPASVNGSKAVPSARCPVPGGDRGMPTAEGLSSSGPGTGHRALGTVVRDYFLFTIVGYVITPELATFFALGDGTLRVNGEPIPLGPFPDNAPPYLGYALLDSALLRTDPGLLRFQAPRQLPTAELESFLIGSDGAQEIEAKAESLIPNRSRPVGPLSQFWEEHAYYTNPHAVNRKLALMNTDYQIVDWETRRVQKLAGVLHDDTTLIAGRRKR